MPLRCTSARSLRGRVFTATSQRLARCGACPARSLRGRVFTATKLKSAAGFFYCARSLRGRVFTATPSCVLSSGHRPRAHSVGASSLRLLGCLRQGRGATRAHSVGASSLRPGVAAVCADHDRALTPWARLHCDRAGPHASCGVRRALTPWARLHCDARSSSRASKAASRAHSVGASSLRQYSRHLISVRQRALTPWARLHCDVKKALGEKFSAARSLRGRVFTATASNRGGNHTPARAHSVGASSLRPRPLQAYANVSRALTPWARLHCDSPGPLSHGVSLRALTPWARLHCDWSGHVLPSYRQRALTPWARLHCDRDRQDERLVERRALTPWARLHCDLSDPRLVRVVGARSLRGRVFTAT